MNRKKGHIDVCLTKDVSYHKKSGLERYEFIHNALPEIDFNEINTETEFLGKRLSFPLIISGMTGGDELSLKINKNLALAAEKCGVAIGVGSQRIALENGDSSTFEIRKYTKMPVLANIGAVQLNYGYSVKECRKAVEMIKADALVLHLNPIQEVVQQGNTDFRGLIVKIKKVCQELGYPVIVKEVGFGISDKAGKTLESCGVYGIDVSGSGGLSWSAVESYLANPPYDSLGKTFWDWGIPTADCIVMNKGLKVKLIAGGGVSNGLNIAKAIALGADYASIAGALLKAATISPDKVVEKIELLRLELKTAMLGTGAKNIEELRKKPLKETFLSMPKKIQM